MELALLLDIGSTYTKATVVDVDNVELKARSKALTTVEDDVTAGIKQALTKIEAEGIDLDEVEHRLACSSAAGGLKLVAIGLVPELTAEAAKRAALGAGAKVTNVYSYEVTKSELEEIISHKPDVILLAGGTDGGNQQIILKNARTLADSELSVPVIVAGNKVATDKVKDILEESGKEVYVTENVMPKLEELNIEPARKTIRQVFLDKIIYAKGLSRAREYVDRLIMPTPSAVMKAAELIAKGTHKTDGLGELVIVDIGGATTDIHSVAAGTPTQGGVNVKGLEEPYVKRTVEGDLGMRYSAPSLLEAIGEQELLTYLSDDIEKEQVNDYVSQIRENVEYVPVSEQEKELDSGLAKAAAKLAIQRHVGRIETVYSPFGESHVQYGKDLTDLDLIIGTGGVLVHNDKPAEILQAGFFDEAEPTILAPIEPNLMLDQDYLVASIGLLAEISASKALELAKKHFKQIGGKTDGTKE